MLDHVARTSRGRSASRVALWTGVAGAPLAWVLHELAASAVVGNACYAAVVAGRPTPEPWGRPVALAITIAALVVAVTAGVLAVRSWHATRPPARDAVPDVPPTRARLHFTAFAGMLLSGVFFLAIFFEGLPLLLTPLCG